MIRNDPIENAVAVYGSKETVRHYSDRADLFETEERLLNQLFPPPGSLVLDLGCGAGRTTAHLHRRGYRIIAVDITPAMIEQARARVPGVDFRVMDAVKLEFPDNTFDTVWFSFNGIDHIFPALHRVAALKQIYRVLKPGGLFVYSSRNMIELILQLRRGRHFWKHMFPYVFRQLAHRGFSAYWQDAGFEIYCAAPFSQKRKLRQVGFESVQLHSDFSRREWVVTLRDRYPHYSARKPLVADR